MEDVRHGLGSYEQAGNEFHGQDSFQAMLGRGNRGDGDLDMLIDQEQDGEGEDDSEDEAQEAVVQLQAEAEEALRTVGREYGHGSAIIRLGVDGGESG